MKCLLVLSLGMLMLSAVASYVSDLGRTLNYNFVLVCLSGQSFHSILVNNNKKVLLNNLALNKFIFHSSFFLWKKIKFISTFHVYSFFYKLTVQITAGEICTYFLYNIIVEIVDLFMTCG